MKSIILLLLSVVILGSACLTLSAQYRMVAQSFYNYDHHLLDKTGKGNEVQRAVPHSKARIGVSLYDRLPWSKVRSLINNRKRSLLRASRDPRDQIRAVPSDSNYYSYSGNRKGDPEVQTPQYDLNDYFILGPTDSTTTVDKSSRSVRTYRSDNKLISDTMFTWDANQNFWLPVELIVNNYDNRGRVVMQLDHQWDGAAFYESGRINFSYYDNDSVKQWTQEIWKNNVWSPYYRFSYAYDAAGNVSYQLNETGKTDGTWEQGLEQFWVYDAQKHLIDYNYKYFSAIHRERYHYDANGQLLSSITIDSSQVVITDSSFVEYTKTGDSVITHRFLHRQGIPDVQYISTIVVYNAQKLVSSLANYSYDNGGGQTLYSLEKKYYDAQGRLVIDSVFGTDLKPQYTYTTSYDKFNKAAVVENFSVDSLFVMQPRSKTVTERTSEGQLKNVTEYVRDSTNTKWIVNYIRNYYYDAKVSVDPDDESTSLQLYPNPATTMLMVESTDAEEIQSCSVLTIDGRQCFNTSLVSQSPSSCVLNIASLSAGEYVLRCVSKKGVRVLAFVKY